MFVKLSVFLLVVQCVIGHGSKPEWELSIVVENEIKLLQANGSVIESLSQPFSSLKALAYDPVRDQFIVSDMDLTNDTIYTVQLKETDTTVPIIKGLPGDVQGLAVDPIEDILYWTDAVNHMINFVQLNSTSLASQHLFVFQDKQPHAIALDVCKRFIYWTNPSHKPTIERARLNGSDHQILVNTSIMSPEGLTIDYKAQRLYWADSRVGAMSGRIESINLDGTDRKIVMEISTMQPFGVAVDENAIYWTDTNNKALYMIMKNSKPDAEPIKLAEFDEMPMGLVANNNIVKEEPDCNILEKVIEEFKSKETDNGNMSHQLAKEAEKKQIECLNDGILVGDQCKCKRGFIGTHCETSICYNYCMQGDCYVSSMGKPQCRCGKRYTGERCQANKCDGFCLNGGDCMTYKASPTPKCSCPDGFLGDRCEIGIAVCDIYCGDSMSEGLFLEKFELLCRCNEGLSALNQNRSTAALISSQGNILSNVNQPIFYLAIALILCIIVILCLSMYARTLQKRRPRIKKRIIVNKSVTPLTYRPQPSTEQQCEITIENCCNMNICETPCFEPREDKKKLLQNMDNEDLY